MVAVRFTKFNGAGNDFILIDNRRLDIKLTPAHAIRLCNRQQGIGADGILVLVPCTSGKADVAWQFWQCDGDTANFCGNGARCFARFVHSLLGHTNPITFETGAGVVSAALAANGDMAIRLPPPTNLTLHEKLQLAGGPHVVHSITIGVPHAVLFVANVAAIDVPRQGSDVRHHPRFGPHGTNVNFVHVVGLNHLWARSFERGVEGETLACGTGVVAAALVAAAVHGFTSPVTVDVQSGAALQIHFDQPSSNDLEFTNVVLIGPAEATFSGTVEL
ncbi:hypothetical protein DYB32_009500 [Aphanomyces invadans]|uniref:Diaminopimelate epimerase n=1 Tax=Aphanomyces invadans TaxID=157072 RepID=A0A3R6VF46_9STRA|nr:hypothetical protein DYB32_009500 [Aphanomyces invadans]